MEIAKVYDNCGDFTDLAEDEPIQKSALNDYLKHLDSEVVVKFLDIIFDETEESQEQMTKAHFINKYKLLIKLIEPVESECDDIGEGQEYRMPRLKLPLELNLINSPKVMSDRYQSSIDKSEPGDNSMCDFFSEIEDFNFRRPSSIVRPINTFKVKSGFDLEEKLDNKLNQKNFINVQNKEQNNNCINPGFNIGLNPCPVVNTNGPHYINFQNNININVNNFGPYNNETKSLPRNSSISQKLQEVYFEINKPDKYFRVKRSGEGNKINNAMNKLEDLISLKKESFLAVNSKRDDYFMDLCKSIHIESKFNKSLRNVSDRIIKMNRKEPSPTVTTTNYFQPNEHSYEPKGGIKYIKYPTSPSSNMPANNINFNQVKFSAFNNFDYLEEQLDNLHKNMTVKPKSTNSNRILDKLVASSVNLNHELEDNTQNLPDKEKSVEQEELVNCDVSQNL